MESNKYGKVPQVNPPLGTVEEPDIPKDPQKWSATNVEKFFKTKQKEFFLSDDDINLFLANTVPDMYSLN